jgi:hypothetical protein
LLSVYSNRCIIGTGATMINEKNRLTSLNFWYPKLKGLAIPMPKTIILPYERNPFDDLDYKIFERDLARAAREIGFPLFMRTDLSAGKHDWKNTCYVENFHALIKNLPRLIESNELADIMGLPYTSIVLREFLDLETTFKAFPGDMPINKERRYFIENGQVLCHHPYWPPNAFEDIDAGIQYACHGWQEKLAELNRQEDSEVILLTNYAKLVSLTLSGFWSVDFAYARNGKWYLIDMAVGEASYHWHGCPNEHRK